MSRQQKLYIKKVLFIFLVFLISLCIYITYYSGNTIVIATKNLVEQQLVAYMLEEVIERDTDINVEVKPGMDATSFLHNAIIKGDIDMYVEYSSTAYIEIFKQIYNGQSKEEVLDYIKDNYQEKYNLRWISTLGFDNSNVIICTEFCEKRGIKTYSELAEYDFSFAAPVYFFNRSDGYNLLEDTYDLKNVTTKNMDPALIYVAVSSLDVDAGLAFSTDGKLASGDYVILEDDKAAFPLYDAGIVVREETLKNNQGLEEILKTFDSAFNNEVIREANQEVQAGNITIRSAAHQLVLELGL